MYDADQQSIPNPLCAFRAPDRATAHFARRPRPSSGPAAQEVKEEPDDTDFRPTEAEVPLLAALRAHGVPTRDALQSLRRKGHHLPSALQDALDTITTRKESQQEDMARLASEKEKDRVTEERRHEEKVLTVLGDIQPRFQQVGMVRT